MSTDTPSNHLPLLGVGAVLGDDAVTYRHQQIALNYATGAVMAALEITDAERAQQAASAAVAAYLRHMRASDAR